MIIQYRHIPIPFIMYNNIVMVFLVTSLLLFGCIFQFASPFSRNGEVWYDFSLDDDLKALDEFAQDINDVAQFLYKDKAGMERLKDYRLLCKPVAIGSGYGLHRICEQPVPENMPCYFLSFGISTDWSFDTEMYSKLGCTGIALDPSITHPLNITPGVVFWKAGANSVGDYDKSWVMYR